jgi:hypothetical protein
MTTVITGVYKSGTSMVMQYLLGDKNYPEEKRSLHFTKNIRFEDYMTVKSILNVVRSEQYDTFETVESVQGIKSPCALQYAKLLPIALISSSLQHIDKIIVCERYFEDHVESIMRSMPGIDRSWIASMIINERSLLSVALQGYKDKPVLKLNYEDIKSGKSEITIKDWLKASV